MATLQCNVVSARETIYTGEISMLIATGVEGEVGILAGHTPFITLLRPGAMQIKTANGADEMVYISGGVLESTTAPCDRPCRYCGSCPRLRRSKNCRSSP